MSQPYTPSARTRVVREPQRGVYDRSTAYQILDEGFICHVGFVVDGQPFVIPTGYGRAGDNLYIHGSAASRMLRRVDEGIAVCVTVTLLDGLVLARSIFNHSMNYRSVMILGKASCRERCERKAGGFAFVVGAHTPWTLGGIPPAQRERTKSDAGAAVAD